MENAGGPRSILQRAVIFYRTRKEKTFNTTNCIANGAKGKARSLTEMACQARGHVTASTADIKLSLIHI